MRFDKTCPPERPGAITSQEALDRMERLVRHMAVVRRGIANPKDLMFANVGDYMEAEEIVALMTDPDMVEAREIAAVAADAGYGDHYGRKAIVNGEADNDWLVKTAMFGIKRGRELNERDNARAY